MVTQDLLWTVHYSTSSWHCGQPTCPGSRCCPSVAALRRACSPTASWRGVLADRRALQRVIKTAQPISSPQLPSLEDTYRTSPPGCEHNQGLISHRKSPLHSAALRKATQVCWDPHLQTSETSTLTKNWLCAILPCAIFPYFIFIKYLVLLYVWLGVIICCWVYSYAIYIYYRSHTRGAQKFGCTLCNDNKGIVFYSILPYCSSILNLL